MKRINVSGDIESRRRIAERRTASAVPPIIIPQPDENSQEKEHETDKDGKPAASPKARRRKTEGNP